MPKPARPICSILNCRNPSKCNGFKKNGTRKYKKMCSHHEKLMTGDQQKRKECWKRRSRIASMEISEGRRRKKACELCGFIATNPCQIDFHHKDGNHKNNAPENKQMVCANCHRLLHYISKTGIYVFKGCYEKKKGRYAYQTHKEEQHGKPIL